MPTPETEGLPDVRQLSGEQAVLALRGSATATRDAAAGRHVEATASVSGGGVLWLRGSSAAGTGRGQLGAAAGNGAELALEKDSNEQFVGCTNIGIIAQITTEYSPRASSGRPG